MSIVINKLDGKRTQLNSFSFVTDVIMEIEKKAKSSRTATKKCSLKRHEASTNHSKLVSKN